MRNDRSVGCARARALATLALIVPFLTAGCETVAFHEKQHLTDEAMSLEEDGAETHLYQKVYYSREASAGGIGPSAGGGCGCY